jgi:hypothetical protein
MMAALGRSPNLGPPVVAPNDGFDTDDQPST